MVGDRNVRMVSKRCESDTRACTDGRPGGCRRPKTIRDVNTYESCVRVWCARTMSAVFIVRVYNTAARRDVHMESTSIVSTGCRSTVTKLQQGKGGPCPGALMLRGFLGCLDNYPETTSQSK